MMHPHAHIRLLSSPNYAVVIVVYVYAGDYRTSTWSAKACWCNTKVAIGPRLRHFANI